MSTYSCVLLPPGLLHNKWGVEPILALLSQGSAARSGRAGGGSSSKPRKAADLEPPLARSRLRLDRAALLTKEGKTGSSPFVVQSRGGEESHSLSVQYHLQRGIVFLQVACPMLKVAAVSEEFILNRKIPMN